jgi:peroxiredoxin
MAVDVIEQAPFWSKIATSSSGKTLGDMSAVKPVLLVFLRHFGCSFCREAIDDIAKLNKRLSQKGVQVVMVHMAPDNITAEQFFKKYKLTPVDHICDPQKVHYAAFGLGRGTPQQLFGLMNWIRGFQAAVIEGHGFAYHNEEIGDGFQMPGVFVLHQGMIKNSFVHQAAWDRPNYEEMLNSCSV